MVTVLPMMTAPAARSLATTVASCRGRRPAASGGAELGRIVRGVDDVLDRDRNAVQRAERVAQRAALVERARLRQHMLAVEMSERPDLAVERVDAIEAGAGIVLGRSGQRAPSRGQRRRPRPRRMRISLRADPLIRRTGSSAARASSRARDT